MPRFANLTRACRLCGLMLGAFVLLAALPEDVLPDVLPDIAPSAAAQTRTQADAPPASGEPPPAASDPSPSAPVLMSLNKMEARQEGAGQGCRLWFEMVNTSDVTYRRLEAELIVFDGDHTILSRYAVEFGPLLRRKSRVTLVDLAGVACEGIGSVLLNDFFECEIEGREDAGNCLEQIDLRIREGVPELM